MAGDGLVRARAPLRVSFAGGGTDVPPFPDDEGGLVLSATIARYATATLRPRQDRQITLESLDFGVSVDFGMDEPLLFDGRLDLVKTAIAALPGQGRERLRPLPALERAARVGPRVVVGDDRGPGRSAAGPLPADDDRLRDRAPRLRARARGARHLRRAAGPLRRDLRRVQLPRALAAATSSSTRCASTATSSTSSSTTCCSATPGAPGCPTTSSTTRPRDIDARTAKRSTVCAGRRRWPGR